MSATNLAERALNTGARLPSIGLGVWQAKSGEVTRNAVATALRLGYRHVELPAMTTHER